MDPTKGFINKKEGSEPRIIEMKRGILGFERLKRFDLVSQEETAPFWQLNSVEDGTIFVVINPFLVKSDYQPVIPDRDVRLLEIDDASDVLLVCIVTIHRQPSGASINLRAPLVINAKKGLAAQVVLEDDEYPLRFPLGKSG